MLTQGFVLLVAGVTIVFLFLSLLVVVMSVSSKIIPRFNHILPDDEPKVRAKKAHKACAPRLASAQDEEIAVAIASLAAHQRQPSKQ